MSTLREHIERTLRTVESAPDAQIDAANPETGAIATL